MPKSFYLLQAEEQERRSQALQQRYNRLSWLRLLLFFGSIALLIVLWSSAGHWGWGFLALPLCLLGFGAFMRWHQGIEAQSAHAAELARQARLELAALEHDFSAWPKGEEYADALHPYAADLDIFGSYSLFQFLCRSYTAQGRGRLAAWLLDPSGVASIFIRQAVAQELALQPEWCHEFRARGARLQDQPSYQQRLLSWAALPPLVASNGLLRAALLIAPLFFGLAIYLFISLPAWQVGVLALLPAVLLLRRYGQKIRELHEHTAAMSEALGHYQALLEWIQSAQWRHPHLLALQAPLQKARGAASAIRSLQYALSQLDVRSNPFSFLLEISVLWSLQWLYSLDRWRGRYGSELAAWLEAMTEVDALISLANVRLNQADWVFPALALAREHTALPTQKENTAPALSQKDNTTDDAAIHEPPSIPFIAARAMAHPLLPPTGRVANDFEIAASGQIHLVTGSNMAGKSTWLRCIGVNMVLAMAGAPVCAQSLKMPPLQVWTSMRTQDDLQESTSSFFAELKRLKAIIDAVTAGETYVFFLLDEILKGTNSRDRHTGARALIQQLIKAQGAGLIATHDLELTAMEAAAAGQVINYAMEVELVEGQLVFDYKIKRGVSQSFNATVLMAQMGIAIAEKDVNLRHE